MSFDIQKFNWCFLSHLVSQEDGLAVVDDAACVEEVDQLITGHGGPTLAELLHQAGHDVPPAPGLRLHALRGENS